LAKPLTDRYQSAAAMKADIDRYLAGKPVQAPIPVPLAGDDTTFLPGDSPTTVTQRVDDEDDEPERRNRTLLVLLVLLVLAILVAGVFLLPRLLDKGPPQETVPALAGMTQTEAERSLTDAGLRLGHVSQDTSPDVPKGQVMAQDPDAGEKVDEDTRVDITISQGKPKQEVPDLLGSNKNSAADQLKALGLDSRLKEKDSDEPQDDVIEMDPAPGTKVADGATVTLFFSDGPESVPDVVGKTEDQARRLIQDAGFEVSVVRDSTTEAKKGTVLDQSPKAGSKEDQGRTVTIVVSSFEPPPSATPTPTPTPTPSPSPTGTGSPTPTP
jgi:beta-lactam-binding protein with PASTA domain